MRAEFDDAARGLSMPDYLYLPTEDNTAPTLDHLQQGVEFIRKIIANEGKVYIHCGSGLGRGPSMVAAYLISEGKTTQEAIQQIKKARPFIRVLPAQVERLEEFEHFKKAARA